MTNTAVHVVMYLYYFLRTQGVEPWWKRYITMFQIVQFATRCACITRCDGAGVAEASTSLHTLEFAELQDIRKTSAYDVARSGAAHNARLPDHVCKASLHQVIRSVAVNSVFTAHARAAF